METDEADAAPEEPAPEEPAAEAPAPEAPAPDRKEPARPQIPAGPAQLMGWCMLAAVNAGFIVSRRAKEIPGSVQAARHFFDAGQLLAVGMLVYAIVESWRRWGPKRPAWWVALSIPSLILGALVLPDDFIGPVDDLLGDNAYIGVYVPAALGGLCLVGAAIAGRLLARRWYLRIPGVCVAIAVAIANNRVLEADYRGIHFMLGSCAATLFGASIAGIVLPAVPSLLRRPPVAWAARLALLVPATLAIVLTPSRVVRGELLKLDGAIVAPRLSWQRSRMTKRYVTDNPWFEDRKLARNIPASTPALVQDPIVVLVTMDSVRAELLEKPEYARKLKRLKALSEESTVFTQARAPGAGTVVTFSQLFSGKHYFQLKTGQDGKRARPRKDTSLRFPELLVKDGIQTVTFVSYPSLVPDNGITRGFSESALLPAREGQELALADQLVDAALPRVAAHDGGRMFLFLHLMDPHHPYDAAGTKGSQFDRYVAEAGLCSEAIGRLVDGLKEAKLWDRTILIVGADHGEGFKKHGVPYHNRGLYEEILRVPLFIRVPGVAGRRVETPVTLLDLGPTILDLFGLSTPGQFMGQSLVPFLRGENPELTRPIVSSTMFKSNAFYSFPYKLILDRESESVQVYDLDADPDERKNLADSKGDELLSMLETFMEVHGLPER